MLQTAVFEGKMAIRFWTAYFVEEVIFPVYAKNGFNEYSGRTKIRRKLQTFIDLLEKENESAEEAFGALFGDLVFRYCQKAEGFTGDSIEIPEQIVTEPEPHQGEFLRWQGSYPVDGSLFEVRIFSGDLPEQLVGVQVLFSEGQTEESKRFFAKELRITEALDQENWPKFFSIWKDVQ